MCLVENNKYCALSAHAASLSVQIVRNLTLVLVAPPAYVPVFILSSSIKGLTAFISAKSCDILHCVLC